MTVDFCLQKNTHQGKTFCWVHIIYKFSQFTVNRSNISYVELALCFKLGADLTKIFTFTILCLKRACLSAYNSESFHWATLAGLAGLTDPLVDRPLSCSIINLSMNRVVTVSCYNFLAYFATTISYFRNRV